jgi:hypothetical protein
VLPRISSAELFGGIKYQPLVYGHAFGTLHIFKGPSNKYDFSKVKRDWVVLCEEVPIDLPAVAALITGT